MSEIVTPVEFSCTSFFAIMAIISTAMLIAIYWLLFPRRQSRASIYIPLVSMAPYVEASVVTCETLVGGFQVIIVALAIILVFLLCLRHKRRRVQITIMSLTSLLPTTEAAQEKQDPAYIWTIPIVFFIIYALASYELIPGADVSSELKYKQNDAEKREKYKEQFDQGIFQSIDHDTAYHDSLRLWRIENRSRRLRNFGQYTQILFKGFPALDLFPQKPTQKQAKDDTPEPEIKISNPLNMAYLVDTTKPLHPGNPLSLLTSVISRAKIHRDMTSVNMLHDVVNMLLKAKPGDIQKWKNQYHQKEPTDKILFPPPTAEEKLSFQTIQHLNKIRSSSPNKNISQTEKCDAEKPIHNKQEEEFQESFEPLKKELIEASQSDWMLTHEQQKATSTVATSSFYHLDLINSLFDNPIDHSSFEHFSSKSKEPGYRLSLGCIPVMTDLANISSSTSYKSIKLPSKKLKRIGLTARKKQINRKAKPPGQPKTRRKRPSVKSKPSLPEHAKHVWKQDVSVFY